MIEIDGRSGAYDLRALFPEYKTVFENPKPVKFLQRFIPLVLTDDGDIFLDFFAGSSSSIHALLELNLKEKKIENLSRFRCQKSVVRSLSHTGMELN